MTRFRTAVVALVAGTAAMGALGLGAGQAAAVSGAGAQPAVVHQASAPAVAADLPVLRDKYWTHSGCITAGRQGIERGHWSQFQCAEGTLQWVLWTDR